jgi:3-hydroxyisobutyrate dehydrogenase-like beta-hydroxyacid dehydrogenase
MTSANSGAKATDVTNLSPVGIVGIGLMGEVLARRLLDAGFSVVGIDVDPVRRARLDQMGGQSVGSVAALAQQARCILIAVFNTEQVEDVVENQLLPALGDDSGKIVACLSTCDPDRIATLAQRVGAGGVRFLDMPISGTSEQVRRGDGVGLIGGDKAAAHVLRPITDALFARCFHVGGVGDGGRAKLAVNLILGLNRLALAEGLVFAERLGLDPAAFLAVARGSASYSQVMETKGPKMVGRDFSPEGRARQTLKDVHLMLDQAKAIGQGLPLLQVNADVLTACVAHGEGDLDNSVVIEEVRRRLTQG